MMLRTGLPLECMDRRSPPQLPPVFSTSAIYMHGKTHAYPAVLPSSPPLARVEKFLYVPAGFPHTTDTVTGMSDGDNDPSVHLTVGVDTHIWGLNYATLRAYSLSRSGTQVLSVIFVVVSLRQLSTPNLEKNVVPGGAAVDSLNPPSHHPRLHWSQIGSVFFFYQCVWCAGNGVAVGAARKGVRQREKPEPVWNATRPRNRWPWAACCGIEQPSASSCVLAATEAEMYVGICASDEANCGCEAKVLGGRKQQTRDLSHATDVFLS